MLIAGEGGKDGEVHFIFFERDGKEKQRVTLAKYGFNAAIVANDYIFQNNDCLYVILHNMEASNSPCSLVKLTFEQEQWREKPSMKSVPMNDMRIPEVFKSCFTVRMDLILLVTNYRFIFFDDDLEVMKVLMVSSANGLGQTLTTCRLASKSSMD